MKRNSFNRHKNISSAELNLSYIQTLNLADFKLSDFKIRYTPKTDVIIRNFDLILLHRKLPNDASFSQVINALGWLGKLEDALKLFELVGEKAQPDLISKIIGPRTLRAILQIYKLQIKASKKPSNNERLANEAESLWKICEEKEYVNRGLLLEMMFIYFYLKQYKNITKIFSKYKPLANFQTHHQYIILLIKMGDLELAHQEFNNFIEQYKENTDIKIPCAMRDIYDTFIIQYFDTEKQPLQALQVFRDAKENGFYTSIQSQKNKGKVELHLPSVEIFIDKKPVHLPLSVAKVAFLDSIQHIAPLEVLMPKIMANKAEQQSDVEKKYGVTVTWFEKSKLVLTIPYAEMPKIRFISDMLAYLNSQESVFSGEYNDATTFAKLTQQFQDSNTSSKIATSKPKTEAKKELPPISNPHLDSSKEEEKITEENQFDEEDSNYCVP